MSSEGIEKIQLEPEHFQDKEQSQQKTSHKNQQVNDKVLTKTKQFYMQRLMKAKQNNAQNLNKNTQGQNQIKQVIQVGLQIQEFLNQDTSFFKLYIQQTEDDFSHLKYHRRQVWVRKAIKMIQLLLERNEEARSYFYHAVNWVKQRVPSYPHVIKKPVCLRRIQRKLKLNHYQNMTGFLCDMNKLWDDSFIFNYQSKYFTQVTTKLRNNFLLIKYQVLQQKNFALQSFINPSEVLEPQLMDIDEQIAFLRENVEIDKNKSQYLDYDPDFYEQSQPNSEINSDQNNKGNTVSKKSFLTNKISVSANKSSSKTVFQSCQSISKTVGKKRIFELKQKILKIIQHEIAQEDRQKGRLRQYIYIKKQQNQKFLGQNNQINLQNIDYDEFIDLQELIRNYFN